MAIQQGPGFLPGSGFRRGEVSIISSRPGQGKTAYITSVLNNLIISGKCNTAVFLPDMPAAEFFSRLTASRAGVDYAKAQRGVVTRDAWLLLTKAMAGLSKARLWISASKRFSSNSVRTETLELTHVLKLQKKKLDVIFIDSIKYLSDCPGRCGDKTDMLRVLKRLAEDTGAAVVCTYSLEALCEDEFIVRARPQLRDFRACGVCEDLVGLIVNMVRSEYCDSRGDYKDTVTLDIVWNSSGAYGQAHSIRFDPNALRFYTEKL